MKEVFCNELKPSLTKIASVTKHQLSNIRRGVLGTGIYYCDLDGETMKVSDAQKKMLRGIRLYTWLDKPCKVKESLT